MRTFYRTILIFLMLAVFRLPATELLVCWGNQGDVPAVALLEAKREPVVLLPGGYSDGLALAGALKQRGLLQLETLFMPTGAPFPRGAATLAKHCRIRQLVVAQDLRSRLPWHELQEQLTREGTALVYLTPFAEKAWRTEIGNWKVSYLRASSGTMRLCLDEKSPGDGSAGRHVFCEERSTGVFVVMREGEARPLLELPKSNRSGMETLEF